MSRTQRRRWSVLGLMSAGLLVAGCTSSSGLPAPQPSEVDPSAEPAAVTRAPSGPLVLDGASAVELAVQAAEAVWASSPVAVTVMADDPASVDLAAARAGDLAVPLLALPPAGDTGSEAGPDADPSPAGPAPSPPDDDAARSGVRAELDRLGVTQVLHVGAAPPTLRGIDVVSVESDLLSFEGAAPQSELTALTAPKAAPRGASAAALGSLAAAGAQVVELAGTDPRERAADVQALAGDSPAGVVGVGAGFGDPATFAQRIEAAATGVQLPGGGQTIFDDKRYVALYGHPLTSALGALGEQGPAATVARARRVAAPYEPLAGESIVPALEIIATVASGSAGKDRDYSKEWPVETLRPLVDRAGRAGIYVVLDLQPGRTDFLTQAKRYEELLREPHVGLAMDPEWRLKPKQVHLRQIGSVSSAEVNSVLDWLAELTDARDLPQKLVVLHQFRSSMITDRQELRLGHDELAVLVQMDGDGTLGQKLATWNALRADAPKGLRFGWKNFYDEDEPTPSPRTTFEVRPKPWWVSYQ